MARTWKAREGPTRILHLFVALLMLIALMAVIPMGTAVADLDTDFEIDGDRIVNHGGNDWDDAVNPVRTFGDLCERLDGNDANSDTIIKQGTKLDDLDDYEWPVVLQSSPKKGDLCLIQTTWEIDGDGHLIFILAWERSDAEGEVTVYVPLDNGSGAIDDGDVLLRYDYDSTAKEISIFEHVRVGGSWGDGTPIADEVYAAAAVSGDQLFAETAVDLNGLSLFEAQGCQAYYSTAVITETGQAEANATLKDYVAVDVTLSNCGALRVVKTAVGGDGTFGFLSEAVGDFEITTSGGTGSVFFDLLEPGVYDLVEDVDALEGWRLASASCASPFEIEQNTTVVCAFENVRDGSITIEKSTVGSGGVFDFTSTLGGFSLGPGETREFTHLGADLYTFTEIQPAGWALGDIACTYRDSEVTASVDDGGVVIDLAPGDSVHCTFVNIAPAAITVWKYTGDADGTFPFWFGGAPFELITEGGVAAQEFDLLPAGVYDITEDVPEGWELSDVTCTDVELWSEITDGVQLHLQPGEHANCYFIDTELPLPRITVVKDTLDHETLELFPMVLSDGDTTVASADLSSGGSATWIVPPGDYELEELVPDDWTVMGTECIGTFAGRPWPLGEGRNGLSFAMGFEDEVTCTFTNVPHPTITVIKDTAGFATTETFPIELRDHEDVVLDTAVLGSGGSHTWVVDPDGWYTIDELIPTGWDLTDVSCTGIDSPLVGSAHHKAFSVAAGDEVVCTFTNEPLPTITVEKEANAAGAFDFVLELDGPYPTESVATGGSHTWTVPVGTFELSEVLPLPARWSLVDVECTGAEWEDLGDATVALSLDHGDSAVCTFTNRYSPPTVTTTTTTTLPGPILDLRIDKTGTVPEELVADDVSPVEWTLVVSHDTDSTVGATNATISDPAPAGMTFTGVSSVDTACAISGNAVTCGPFDLALGDTITVEIDATVEVGGDYLNTGTVTVPGDVDPTNNVDSAEVLVPEVLGLEILPETGMDVAPLAWVAGLLLLLGALSVRAVGAKSDSRF